jgi:guanine deaminase
MADRLPRELICPGFIDGHVHHTQTPVIGSYGDRLADWLNGYAFPEEQRYADPGYASAVARVFFDQMMANGTPP